MAMVGVDSRWVGVIHQAMEIVADHKATQNFPRPPPPLLSLSQGREDSSECLAYAFTKLPMNGEAGSFEGGEAIPFVVDTGQGYRITDEASAFLKTVPQEFALGDIGSGKSFILNQLFLDKRGFPVGSGLSTCTKGMWIWNKTVTVQEGDESSTRFLLIDTEGFGSPEESHDSSLLTLSLLLSSYFVYNSVGAIDEIALRQFAFVSDVLELIASQKSDFDGRVPSNVFPSFVWLLRDFSLELVSPDGQRMLASEYLEQALSLSEGEAVKGVKQTIRKTFAECFKERDCVALVRPVIDELKLQNLAELGDSALRPQFVEQVKELRQMILENARAKQINQMFVSGNGILSLTNSFLQSLAPSPSLLLSEGLATHDADRKGAVVVDAALRKFEDGVDALEHALQPLSDVDFERWFETSSSSARRVLLEGLTSEEHAHVMMER
eukprot:228832-Hanusia_phi.AAC.1